MLTNGEKKELDEIFYEKDNYMFGINKFLKEVRKAGNHIPLDKIEYYYNNQEIAQRFKPKGKLKVMKIIEGARPFEKVYCDTMFLTS